MAYIERIRKLVGNDPIIFNSSGLILRNNSGHVLLQYRIDTKNWGLPGGYMELGETFKETLIRELKEEMSLSVKELTLYDVFSGADFYHEYPNGDKVYSVIAIYLAEKDIERIKVDYVEISEVKFFPVNKLPEKLTKQPKKY